MDVGQALISFLESVGEAEVISAEESEDCGVEVVYVHWVLANFITEIIRGAAGSVSRYPFPGS